MFDLVETFIGSAAPPPTLYSLCSKGHPDLTQSYLYSLCSVVQCALHILHPDEISIILDANGLRLRLCSKFLMQASITYIIMSFDYIFLYVGCKST